MSLVQILPFISTIIMIVFTVSVFRRYAARRTQHFLFWGIGLAMFTIGSFAEAYLAVAWSALIFFCWYLFGAALNAAYIGHGTLHLLVRKRWASWLTVALVVASVFAAAMMLRAMTLLDSSSFSAAVPISEQYREMMPPIDQGGAVRLTTPFFNIYGLITLVGGALYSAWLFWRKRILPNRVLGNILIAAGALFIGSAGALARFGYGQFLFAGELISAILMYWGFILAGRPAPHLDVMAETAPAGAD